ncbi:hypothetical protein FB446DRAFT_705411 [Lentinula raphanica]|nr:hypothetical protein FB446DRAFT_705411 [Lentinula raphanica]
MTFSSRYISKPFSKPSKPPVELSKADVISLMDPSYRFPHHQSFEPVKAHVDSRGQPHDPDFRDFPVLPGKSKHRRSPFAGLRSQWDDEVDEDYEQEDGAEEIPIPHQRRSRRQSFNVAGQYDSSLPSVDPSYHYSDNPHASSSSTSVSSDTSSLSSYTRRFLGHHHPVDRLRSFDFLDWYYQYDPDYHYEEPVQIATNEEFIREPAVAGELQAQQATPMSYAERIQERWEKSRFGDTFKRKSSKLSTVSYP